MFKRAEQGRAEQAWRRGHGPGSDGLKEEFQGLWQAVVRLWIGGSGHGEKGRAKQGRCNFVWCV